MSQAAILTTERPQRLCATETTILSSELAILMGGKQALVVEPQIPIALEIQELLLDHGATDVRIAASLLEARRLLANGFKPHLAVIDLARFDADARDLVDFLQGAQAAVVVTMASSNGRSQEEKGRHIVVTKPYFESELKDALVKALRGGEADKA